MQLAYDLLAKKDDPQVAQILDNVVLMLWPTINPDGHQMVADWYMKNAGTPNETLPRLYQEYVGHDNNRDAYMLNMIESRVMEHAWRQWEPQIIYVQHQSSPFPTRIWLPPFAEPIATHAPFLMSREVNAIGMAIAQGLEERGQVGATHMGTGYDAWYAGYIDYTPMFKNIASFWTETALAGMANTSEYTLEELSQGLSATCDRKRSTPVHGSPGSGRCVMRLTTWLSASMSVLDYAARYKENVLLNRYRSGKRQIEQHRKDGPFAYVIPQKQRDTPTAVEMLRRLAFGGVRVSQASGADHRRRRNLSGRHVGDSDRSGIHRAGARSPRSPGLSRLARVRRRPARTAVRRGRMDVAHDDGRASGDGDEAAERRRSRQPEGACRRCAVGDQADAI